MNIVFFLNRQNLINWTNQNWTLILLCERSSSRWSYQRSPFDFLSFFLFLVDYILVIQDFHFLIRLISHSFVASSFSFISFLPCISILHLLFIYILQFHPTFKKGSVHAKNEEKRVNCDTEKSKRSFYNIRRINALPLPLNFHPLTRFIIIPASK